MDVGEFQQSADRFRKYLSQLVNALPRLNEVETLVVEGTGTVQPDATPQQNAILYLQGGLGGSVHEVVGAYDSMLQSLGAQPRYGVFRTQKGE